MTRLGLHANSNNATAKLVEYCRRVKPNAVKLLDPNRRVVEQIKAASPQTIVIGRKYWADQRLSQYGEFRGAAFSLAVESGVDYMEGMNEMAVEADSLSTFARSEVSLARDLNDRGIGAAIGGFSTGYLDSNRERAWDRFQVAFEYMQAAGRMCVLGFHEYSNYLQYGTETPDGRNQWNHAGHHWTGFSDDKTLYWNPTLEGWWTLRYRKLWKQLRAAGFDNIFGLITEFGTDDINPRPGEASRKGWRDWKGTQWFTSPQCGDFVDQCLWYMWQVSHDPYILGVVDFGFATADPTWLSFDFSHEPEHLERLMQTQAGLPSGTIGGGDTMTEGIDVSHWQGRMNWTKAASSGVKFAWVKATEGSGFVDGEMLLNARGADAAGVLVGAYHFYRDGADLDDQVEHFLTHLARHEWTLPPAIDCEDTAVGRVNAGKLRAFCEAIHKRYGARPVIYTGAWWWTDYRLGGPQPWAAEYPLWVADYSGAVSVPADWTRAGKSWTIHQYTSTADGRALGAQSMSIDRNRTALKVADLQAMGVKDKPPVFEFDVEGLKRAAIRLHEESGIRVNPSAALFQAARQRGLNVVTNEVTFGPERVPFVVAESYGPDRRKVVLYWRGGKVYEAAL